MSVSEAFPAPEWPESDLEWRGKCPVCESIRRNPMFEGLSDLTFGVAPGTWTLWKCSDCSSGYIDPRPSKSTIGRAYTNYYTHTSANGGQMASFIAGGSVKTRLKVGYYNAAYGYKLPTGISIGYLVASALAQKRAEWDHFIRHLPAPEAPHASLLDIGCGAGDFLQVAQQLGYSASGLDPDPSAVEFARGMGLAANVGGLPDTGLCENGFDQICLNHVLEHLHEPVPAFAELFRVLKPGGRIWLAQPNINAIGLDLFGKNWRGLEAPRHLVLMGADGLMNILEQAGFVDVRLLGPRPEALGSFRASLSISEGALPVEDAVPSGWDDAWRRKAREADKLSASNPSVAESLTLVAWKPRGSRAF